YALEPTLATPARASRSPISALPISLSLRPLRLSFFFLKATAPPETYTLSLHDALPIWPRRGPRARVRRRGSRQGCPHRRAGDAGDRKSTRLNSSHVSISYAVFCLKKKKKEIFALVISTLERGEDGITDQEHQYQDNLSE